MAHHPVRILIVDDHALFRQGLRQLLATTEDLVVVGEAASGSEALERVAELAPDVVLMDIAMPDLDGIAATATLRQRFPDLRIVMLTMYEAATHEGAARAAGACDYVVKSSRPEELFHAIRRAVNGSRPAVEPALPPRPIPRFPLPEAERLARLERRLQWLEAQLAQLKAQQAAPATTPPQSASATEAPPDLSESTSATTADHSPATMQETAEALVQDSPVSAPPLPAAPSPPAPITLPSARAQSARFGRLTVLPSLVLILAVFLVAAALLGLLPGLGSRLHLTQSALLGLLASGLALVAALAWHNRPDRAHLVLLLAVANGGAWPLAAVAPSVSGQFTLGIAAASVALDLLAGALAWRRGFLAALALANALAVVVSTHSFSLVAAPWSWSLAGVTLASLLANWELRRTQRPLAWEWLPLAPLLAATPFLVSWSRTQLPLERALVTLPWLAVVPTLWLAARTGRVTVALATSSAVLLLAIALGASWGTPRPLQSALLALAGSELGILAALLAGGKSAERPGTTNRFAPWEAAAAPGALSIALAATWHPEPVLAPLTWCALALLALVLAHRRSVYRVFALLSFAAGCLSALELIGRGLDGWRAAMALGAIALATVGGSTIRAVAGQPLLRSAWLLLAAASLAWGLAATLSGLGELAAVCGLTLGFLMLGQRASRDWSRTRLGWLPVAIPAATAFAASIRGPLAPARLGLSLQPTISATSEPVLAATILVATTIIAGRLLGRRWRPTLLGSALLVVAYVLPAILPDAALVLSWLALAIALFHTAVPRRLPSQRR